MTARILTPRWAGPPPVTPWLPRPDLSALTGCAAITVAWVVGRLRERNAR